MDDVVWEPPGPGQWYLTTEHFPRPVSLLFASLFPPTTLGWQQAARRYGLPDRIPRWARVNGWLYYARSGGGPGDEAVAAATLQTAAWRDDLRRWPDVDRPRIVAANLALQREDIATMDDAALAGHLRRAMAHFLDAGAVHFELHITYSIAGGLAVERAAAWGIGLAELLPLLAGSSPGSSAARTHIDRIVAALEGRQPSTLGELRAAGDEAAAALDAYLAEYGWRGLDQHEIRGSTLAERPDVLLASVRARQGGLGGSTPAADPEPLRNRVPPDERRLFDEGLAELRAAYGLNDDNVGVTWGWPLGLVRRGVLEAARRLAERRAIGAGEHAFEAQPEELFDLLAGGGPAATELAARAGRFAAAIHLQPPAVLGEPAPAIAGSEPSPAVARLLAAEHALWADHLVPAQPLSGLGIGDVAYRGRACVVDGDGYLDLEPGDVLVATVTHAGHNTVFPIAGAIATEYGGPLSHPAVLARELGLPAVVGVRGLLARVRSGQIVEVDPVAGVVRVVE